MSTRQGQEHNLQPRQASPPDAVRALAPIDILAPPASPRPHPLPPSTLPPSASPLPPLPGSSPAPLTTGIRAVRCVQPQAWSAVPRSVTDIHQDNKGKGTIDTKEAGEEREAREERESRNGREGTQSCALSRGDSKSTRAPVTHSLPLMCISLGGKVQEMCLAVALASTGQAHACILSRQERSGHTTAVRPSAWTQGAPPETSTSATWLTQGHHTGPRGPGGLCP